MTTTRMNDGLQKWCLIHFLFLDDTYDIHAHYDHTLRFNEQYKNFKIKFGISDKYKDYNKYKLMCQ